MSENLPLPNYDHLPLGSLEHRIRSLDEVELGLVLAYEREHANRAGAVTLMEARLRQLRAGAEPSGGDPAGLRPEAGDATSPGSGPASPGGSPVSAATAGPAINPPSHGVPTNPAQPRSTG